MKSLKKLRPAFWDHHTTSSSATHKGVNFQRKWKLIVTFTTLIAVLPLLIMGFMDFRLTRKTMEEQMKQAMASILTATAVSISTSRDIETSVRDYVKKYTPDGDEEFLVIQQNGKLLTPSRYFHGHNSLNGLHAAPMTGTALVKEAVTTGEKRVFIGFIQIPDSTLALALIKNRENISDLWLKPRVSLIGYLGVSILIILLSIMGMATYLVGRIHRADRRRRKALHHIGYNDKLASIGRLAGGIAHEINNPLAIIDQKTGLMLDIFSFSNEFPDREKLIKLTKDILETVHRCGTVTKRLLDFSRHMDSDIEPVDLKQVMEQIFAFLNKDAERQGITMTSTCSEDLKGFECDRGNLQQILLSLFNNAFAAMETGGELTVNARLNKGKKVIISVSDTGVGIHEEDINQIFEPFFSSRDGHWGTGLGLSITYGLVKEMNGDIVVKSKVGKGTTFLLIFPLIIKNQDNPDSNKDLK